MPKNEQQQFLEEVENKDVLDQLDAPLVPETKPGEGEKPVDPDENPEQVDESVKNRRHKRLEAQLKAEREANIAMSERLKVISESKQTRESDASYLKDIERVYGTETPEAREATNLLKSALENLERTSTEKALQQLRDEQEKQRNAIQNEERTLDTIIEDLEDEHGITLTDEQQRGYFKLLEKMSPKDSDGNVIAYADANAVWEEYSSKLQAARKTDNKAKNLASRSVSQGGSSNDSKLADNALADFLTKEGII